MTGADTARTTMIEKLRLRNFKSIIEADVQLSDFTVLVGANGSGKSNLVEALALLGAIPGGGVAGAVNRFGGFRGLVPKAIPLTEVPTTRVSIGHRALLPPPWRTDRQLPPVAVEHELELADSKREIVSVAGEKIAFHQPLAVAEALAAGPDAEPTETVWYSEPSEFVLVRGPRGAVDLSTNPPITQETLPRYLTWLGMPFLEGSVTSATGLRRVLDSIQKTRGEEKRSRRRYHSFLDPDFPTVVDYAEQFRLFRSLTGGIKLYDLLLSQLRYEQPVSDSRRLSPQGLNMPSVIRHLRSSRDGEASWRRTLSTLGAIAPHVTSMRPSSLRTGKEFVEFLETATRRGVESWESSDGTLRAVAILLALETHLPSSTILIEEPEQNLHPWAIRAIVDHVRDVIAERKVQVIVTTHSPQVLERVRPEEVLVTSRTDERGTEFRTLEQILPHSAIVMGEVADLWVKGLLGGVPSEE